MLSPRQCNTLPASYSLPSAFAPVRLAGWLAVVLILSKSFSLDRTRDYWWLLDLSMASFSDVLFALCLGTVASITLRAANQRTAIAAGLHDAFVGICVNVPLILWNPRLFPGGQRIDTIGGHVDLNATVAELMGIQPPGDWQGHSMFDPARPQRAYYLASIGEYLFGVREGKWKYTFEATSGREFLTDLTADPDELKNVAGSEPDLCRKLRHRVAAWVDYEDKFMRPARD